MKNAPISSKATIAVHFVIPEKAGIKQSPALPDLPLCTGDDVLEPSSTCRMLFFCIMPLSNHQPVSNLDIEKEPVAFFTPLDRTILDATRHAI